MAYYLLARPIVQTIQGVFVIFWIFATMPFFNLFVNAAFAGIVAGRVCSSIVFFISIFVNTSNNVAVGMGFAFGAMGAFVVGFIVVFIAVIMWGLLIRLRVRRYDTNSSKSEVRGWNLTLLEMNMRLTIRSENSRANGEKLIQHAALYHIERPELYINIANYHLFKQQEELHSAMLFFKKALSLKPSYLTTFVIMMRIRDIEQNMTDNSDTKDIYKMLAKVKSNESKIIMFIKQFWKELLNRKGTSTSVLASTAANIESYVSSMLCK